MSSFAIQRIEASQIESATRMWRRSRDEVQPELEARAGYSAEDDLAYFANVLVKTNEVWLAVRDDSPIGLLSLDGNSIGHLYVDPSEQGRGIGSSLMDFAKQTSPKRLELFTHVSNTRARNFYESRGFRAVAFGISPPPESEPDVKYVWDGKPRQ